MKNNTVYRRRSRPRLSLSLWAPRLLSLRCQFHVGPAAPETDAVSRAGSYANCPSEDMGQLPKFRLFVWHGLSVCSVACLSARSFVCLFAASVPYHLTPTPPSPTPLSYFFNFIYLLSFTCVSNQCFTCICLVHLYIYAACEIPVPSDGFRNKLLNLENPNRKHPPVK